MAKGGLMVRDIVTDMRMCLNASHWNRLGALREWEDRCADGFGSMAVLASASLREEADSTVENVGDRTYIGAPIVHTL